MWLLADLSLTQTSLVQPGMPVLALAHPAATAYVGSHMQLPAFLQAAAAVQEYPSAASRCAGTEVHC